MSAEGGSASGHGGGSTPPTAQHRGTTSGVGASPTQQNLGQLPKFAASPQSQYISAEFTALMKKLVTVEKAFQRKEQDLREETDQLLRQREDEQTRLAHEEKLAKQRMELERRNHENKMAWEKENLEKERKQLERMKEQRVELGIQTEQGRAIIDVGGHRDSVFKTQLSTLARYKDSLFPELIKAAGGSEKLPIRIFIDRDAKHFRLILNFLRQGEEVLRGADLRKVDQRDLHEILCEAKYYRLSALERLIERQMIGLQVQVPFTSLVTKEHLFSSAQPLPSGCKYITTKRILLKCRNLAAIEFDHVYFKHPVSFEGSILAMAKFKECVFEAAVNFTNADLHRTSFDHCEGLELSKRFVINGTNMDGVTFNPPLRIE